MATSEQTLQRPHYRKHHVIYKTTCKITNKFYIGMHSTDDLNDCYFGSGKIVHASVKKYGIENHVTEILEHLPNRAALCSREEELITDEIRNDPLCMNIARGGIGNYPGKPVPEETRKKLSEVMKGRKITWADKISAAHTGMKRSREAVEKQRAKVTGRIQSDEERKMRSDAVKDLPAYHSKPVIIYGIEYADAIKASRDLGLTPKQVYNKLHSKYNLDFQYKDSPKEPKQKIAPCSKAVEVDGVVYPNMAAAHKALGITKKMLAIRLKSDKYPNFKFCDVA